MGLVDPDLDAAEHLTWSRVLRTVRCPLCGVNPGRPCRLTEHGRHHDERWELARRLFRSVVTQLAQMSESDLGLAGSRQAVGRRAQRARNGL